MASQPAARAWIMVVVARSTSMTTATPPARRSRATRAGARWTWTARPSDMGHPSWCCRPGLLARLEQGHGADPAALDLEADAQPIVTPPLGVPAVGQLDVGDHVRPLI